MTDSRVQAIHTASITDAIPDTLLVVDAHGTVERVAGDTARMTGYLPGDLVGRPVTALLSAPSADRIVAAIGDALTAGADAPPQVVTELTARRSDGSALPVEALLLAFDLDSRGRETVLVTLRDDRRSTLRREEEREARAVLESSNRDLEAFASVAAHDLQEPVRKIRAFADRARTAIETGDMDRALSFLERVDASADRMQGLLDDLLTLARVGGQQPDRRVLDLGQLIRETAEELMSTRDDVTIEVEEIPPVEADPVHARQLFANLLGNAMKFTRPNVPPRVSISGELAGDLVNIRISDNGIGFDDEYRERIFRPFERLHGRSTYEGTGVGLALCRTIAERHGGSITASGRPGEGATFVVSLPAGRR